MPWTLQKHQSVQTVNFYRPTWNPNHFKNHTMPVSIARLISKLQTSMAPISNPDKLTSSACTHMHSGHRQPYKLLVCAYFSLHEILLWQHVGTSFWAISHTLIYQHSLWLTSSLVSRCDWTESDSERRYLHITVYACIAWSICMWSLPWFMACHHLN